MIQRTIAALLILTTSITSAVCQEPVEPRPSPMASISMKHKDAYVRIVYSQPQKNGRQVFGKLVPYGKVWRTGANEATEITVTRDIILNNVVLKAGTYSIFSVPDKNKWTIIINGELGLWGSYNYNPKLDIIRFDVPVSTENVIYESFTMAFDQKNELADLLIRWDNIKVQIPVKFIN